jgi:hypothetical protein
MPDMYETYYLPCECVYRLDCTHGDVCHSPTSNKGMNLNCHIKPIKLHAVEELRVAAVTESKRGRGRPPKTTRPEQFELLAHQVLSQSVPQSNTAPLQSIVKRGPGRPRKYSA